MNPVRAGLVNRPEDWEWSSNGYYAQGVINSLIDPDPLFISSEVITDSIRQKYQQTLDKTRAF
jgi:hypothetical protein